MERYKLRVRVGNAEFEADGPQDVVKDQFDLFMGCLASTPSTLPPRPAAETIEQRSTYREVYEPPTPEADASPRSDDPSQNGFVKGDPLSRIFLVDEKNHTVSLKFLPSTKTQEPDTLLLLIYGFRKATGEEHVGANDLIAAARKSGLTLPRVDRVLASQKTLVQKGGKKRGTRYFLTNPGISKAESLIRELEGQMPS